MKPASDDAWLTAESGQVSKYWDLYRLVLVTNTRDFVLLGEDAHGNPAKLETFRLAGSAADFEVKLQHPRAYANAVGPSLAEYLGRACPTGRHWPNPATWHGCWPPTPATAWPASRHPATSPRSTPCARRWRRPWA